MRFMLQKKAFLYIVSVREEKMDSAEQILNWYILSGVDEICADEVSNMLVPAEKNIQQTSGNKISSGETELPATTILFQTSGGEGHASGETVRPATTILAQDNSRACVNAAEICAKAQTLSELKEAMDKFEGCSLKFSANSTVFGYGNPQAELMLIGEAPGADEDMAGKPFVGRSGKLLTDMLSAIKTDRNDCYITNVLPWRPPGNRTPTDGEVAVCLPFLKRQIELVRPQCIFLLGGSAANALLNNAESISRLRGHFLDYTLSDGTVIPVLAGFHPAYLLRSPQQKAKAWSDLLRLQRKLADIRKN